MGITEFVFILADNQALTRAGWQRILAQYYVGVGQQVVSSKQALVEALEQTHGRSIVLLDYALFDLQSLDELLVLEKRFRDSYWLLVANELNEPMIRRLSAELHVGFLLKECGAEEIRTALQCAVQDEPFYCHMVANVLAATPEPETTPLLLTPTETEILKLIAHGKSVKEIAALRNSSVHTVTTHKKNLFRKLEVSNVYEATKYAHFNISSWGKSLMFFYILCGWCRNLGLLSYLCNVKCV